MKTSMCAIVLATGLLAPFGATAQDATPVTPPEATTETAAPPVNETPSVEQPETTSVDTPAEPAETGKVGPAPADKAQVVFFRPSKMMGGAVGFKVREGEQELGKLRSGNYFIHLAEPGTHEYTVHSEAKDVLTMEVEEGETYFVQGTISMGVMAGRPNLSPSDEAAFNAVSEKLKASKPVK